MFENEILTPGKKIKKLRTLLGIVQKEIVGNKSTNLLGQIENGKTTLTHSTALIIVKNINNIIIQRKLQIQNITIEWLMEDLQVQINRKSYEYIENLEKKLNSNDEFTNYIDEIESFIQNYAVLEHVKIQIFNLAIDFYTRTYNFNKKKIYLLRLKDLYFSLKNHESELECMYQIMIIYFRLSDFKYAIDLGIYILSNTELYSIENESFIKKIYFNIALSYKKIGSDKCLEYLQKLQSKINLNLKEKLDIELLKANYHKEKKNYKKAEAICLNIVKIEENSSLKAATYSTLSEIYLENNNIEMAENCINEAIKIDVKNDNYIVQFLYNSLKINIAKCNTDKVKLVFNKCIEKAIIINNSKMQYDICNETYKYLTTINDFDFILNILDIISKLKDINKDIIKIYINAINYFKDKDVNIREKLLEKMVNL